MKAFFTYLMIQFKMDLRDKGTLLNFYLVPLLFFAVMGTVFSSVNPQMKVTLSASMSIFAITMGAVMGIPAPIVKMRESGTLRAFKVNSIPDGAVLLVQAISAFLHIFVVSMIIFAVSPLAFKSEMPSNIELYFAVVLIFLFASIAIGLLVGVVARNQSVATMLSMIIFLPSLLLSGIMFPASMLPKTLIWIGRIFPSTSAMQAFYGLSFNLTTDYNPFLALCINLIGGLFILGITLWRFKAVGRSE